MARPKQISNELVMDYIRDYFVNQCNSNPKCLKLPDIVKYINNNGYPDYHVESLRRNPIVRDFVEKLKNTEENQDLRVVSAHKTLDVETFLHTHKDRKSLIRALSELDHYYANLANSATRIFRKNDELKCRIDELTNNYQRIETELAESKDREKTQKAKERNLIQENKTFRKVIDDYLYPEIANELLKREGILHKKESTKLKKDVVDTSIIDANTPIVPANSGINNNVISGLFQVIEEE